MKRCNGCGTTKPHAAFARSGSSLQSRCRACQAAYVRRRRESDAEWRAKQSAKAKAWHAANPDGRRRWERNNRAALILIRLRHSAKRDGVPFDLKASDISIPSTCPVLGIPMHVGTGNRETRPDGLVSFDRLVPELGYVSGNVRAISMRANRLKGNATLDELRAIVAYVERETGGR